MSIDAATPFTTQADSIPGPADSVKTLADYRRMFDDFRNVFISNRYEQDIDVDYYDGKQLTVGEKQVLSKRGQPDIVINRIRTAVNGILGIVVQSKVDLRCYPRTPNDEDSADVATDTLRYITHKARWNSTKKNCFKDVLIPGVAGVLIGVKPNKEIDLVQVRWEELFWDPRSRREDFKDAEYIGIAKWMYLSRIKRTWPETFVDNARFSAVEGLGGMVDASFEDRPRNQGAWLDPKNQRAMVIEVYHQYDEQWYKCAFWGGGVLEESISPYLDDKGQPCNPIEAMSAYVDRDNNRYGVTRDFRDIQDEINKRRSKLLHILNSHQIQAKDPSAIEVNADEARTEAARPDGVIPYGWEIVRTTDMSAGQMQLLAEAKNEMERLGPNPAVLGRQGSDTSGRALLARQQAGLIELAIHLDTLDDWEHRCASQMWWRAQQYWTDPQWLRITDDPDSPKFVQLNAPRPQPQLDDGGNPVRYPATAEDGTPHPQGGQVIPAGPPQFDPESGESVFGYDNTIAETDIDIIIDTEPQTANIMQEILQDLIKLVSASPSYAAQVPFELFLELSPIPRKRQLLQKLKEFQTQQSAQQGQMQQQQMAMQTAELSAKIEEMHATSISKVISAIGVLAKGGAMDDANRIAADSAATEAAQVFHGAVTDQQAHEREVAGMAQDQQQHDAEMQQQSSEPPASGQDA